MAGLVKRFPDLAASAAEADTDLLALKQSVASPDATPVKWSLAAVWSWILGKITGNSGAVGAALGLGNSASRNVGTTAGTVAAGDDSRIAAAAPLNSPAFTGVPTAPTAAQGTNTNQLATVAFARAEMLAKTSTLITASGNWTVPYSPSGFVWVDFAVVGSGGGGGGVAAAVATAASGTPGWNGTLKLKIASGTVVAFVIGTGGAGGAAGNNNGANGVSTTITVGGTTYTMPGGIGGAGSASGNAAVATTQTTATITAQIVAMKFTESSDAFWSVIPTIGVALTTGAAGVGGQCRDTVHGTAGVAALNSAGGNASGYGNAGAGAGSATGAAALAGGNGSPACVLVSC
jgi:hypothetical protein